MLNCGVTETVNITTNYVPKHQGAAARAAVSTRRKLHRRTGLHWPEAPEDVFEMQRGQ